MHLAKTKHALILFSKFAKLSCMDIKKITKQILKDRGWTQDHLAREVGIHPVTLCRLLRNPYPPKSAYDKLVTYLLSLTGGPGSPANRR